MVRHAAIRDGHRDPSGWSPRRRTLRQGLAVLLLTAVLLGGASAAPPRGAGAATLWPGHPAVAPVEPALAPPAGPAATGGGPGAAGPPAGLGRGAAVPTRQGAPGSAAAEPGGAGSSDPARPGTGAWRPAVGAGALEGSAAAAFIAPERVPEGVAPLWRHRVEPPPAPDAAAAIVVDAASGQVLYAHNAHQRRPPASTTKILTAIVALEYGSLDDVVTVSAHAAATEGSTMDLEPGERYTLRELLWGLMLESGNDAAVAIAEHIAGSEAAFARLMNETVLRLGLRDTHFTNPHGLHDPGHYSTAYDLAAMTRYALANQYFARLVCQPEKVLCRGDGDWVRVLSSTNRLLWYHEWVRGVKTGTTGPAGPCLVSSGERDGRRLIAVVLDSGDRWADSQRLLEWGFRAFAPVAGGRQGEVLGRVPVRDGMVAAVEAQLAGDLGALVPPAVAPRVRRVVEVARAVAAPVAAGQRVGTARLELDGVTLASQPLVAAAAVPLAPWWRRALPW